MRGKLICFIGTDGSGKSTVARRMQERLNKSNRKCRNIWAAYDLRFFRVIIKTAKRLLMKNDSPYKNYSEYKQEMQKASKNSLFLTIYKLLVFSEYWAQVFFKVRLPLLLGYVILCDRYVYDVVINISSNLDLNEERFSAMLKKWLKFFPAPDLIILVSVPPEVSVSRKDDIPDIEYVRRRFQYYHTTARYLPVHIVDGTETPVELEEKVYQLFVAMEGARS
jgi:thymidylate kinase